MGNRAFIMFRDRQGTCSPAIYLHSNGNPECVYALVDAAVKLGMMEDVFYTSARFAQMAAAYVDHTNKHSPEYKFNGIGLHNGPHQFTEYGVEPSDELKAITADNHGLYIFDMQGRIEKRVFKFRPAAAIQQPSFMPDSLAASEYEEAKYSHEHTEILELLAGKQTPNGTFTSNC
ncbi:MAG: hypothetical protein V3V10_02595 [Planctomycetota bacterium]